MARRKKKGGMFVNPMEQLGANTLDMCGLENDPVFLDYFNRLKELALNSFEWVNLPETVSERFLEMILFEKGYALYFQDEIAGDVGLTCTFGGPLNIYRIPIWRRPYAPGFTFKGRNSKNSVMIFNNYLHTPTYLTTILFAKRLALIERAMWVNVNAQKTPVVILTDETQRLTMENLYEQYAGDKPFIFGNSSLDINMFKVLKTDAPYVADKLEILKHNVWNEALTFFGIDNANQDKRERLVSDEVAANYGNIEAQRNVMLNARREACDKINRMFDRDISVRFRTSETMGEGENDEQVYNAGAMDNRADSQQSGANNKPED